MVNHLGYRCENIEFQGGPLDGEVKQFMPDMMCGFYVHREPWTLYRLHRVANPHRQVGFIDLVFVAEGCEVRP